MNIIEINKQAKLLNLRDKLKIHLKYYLSNTTDLTAFNNLLGLLKLKYMYYDNFIEKFKYQISLFSKNNTDMTLINYHIDNCANDCLIKYLLDYIMYKWIIFK